MAVSSRGRSTEIHVSRRWKETETSPERTKVWTEPKHKSLTERKVQVVYYLSRNGHLDQPHFIEVTVSSNEGLYLRDVIERLNVLRGKGMASMYSWSSKRSYKNGFVWHDLSESDFIYPAHGQEYVLKGSELLDPSVLNPKVFLETRSFRAIKPPELDIKSENDPDSPVITRRRNQSWSSIDLNEYKVYKSESTTPVAARLAADASTQTDTRRRKSLKDEKEEIEEAEETGQELYDNQSVELNRDEISPPPSDSSPETLESLMQADKRLVLSQKSGMEEGSSGTAESYPSGRMKASTVLMQLISCGAISLKECGPTLAKDQGLSLIGHYNKPRLPRGAGKSSNQLLGKEAGSAREFENFAGLKLEDKEYFSGSLIETKKTLVPALKRSSSYNADRRWEGKKECDDGVRAKCIPRALQSKKHVNDIEVRAVSGCLNG